MTAPSWYSRAGCHGLDPELFFPVGAAEPGPEAQEACGSCPVRSDCLEFALRTGQAGVWGGLTEGERRGARRKATRRASAARAREERGEEGRVA